MQVRHPLGGSGYRQERTSVRHLRLPGEAGSRLRIEPRHLFFGKRLLAEVGKHVSLPVLGDDPTEVEDVCLRGPFRAQFLKLQNGLFDGEAGAGRTAEMQFVPVPIRHHHTGAPRLRGASQGILVGGAIQHVRFSAHAGSENLPTCPHAIYQMEPEVSSAGSSNPGPGFKGSEAI